MKLKIIQDDFTDGVSIYFYQERDGKRYLMPEVSGEFKEIDEGTAHIRPTMKIPGFAARELLESMAEELDKKNIKTPNTHLIEGKLQAREYHLEDLRKLLKLK